MLFKLTETFHFIFYVKQYSDDTATESVILFWNFPK